MASVKFAENSPEPPLEELYAYTYVDDGNDPSAPETAAPSRKNKPAKRTSASESKSRRAADVPVSSNGDGA